MNIDSDILETIISKLDNDSIRQLSSLPLWNQILPFASTNHFWRQRTQTLIGLDLARCPDQERFSWKEVYYILSRSREIDNDEDNALAVRVLLLLEVDPAIRDNEPIRLASRNGHTEIVRLLLQDERVDPSSQRNTPLLRACNRGHTEIVRLLLGDERIDPSCQNNESFRLASTGGYTEVMDLLLRDPRVNPASNNSIIHACYHGRTDAVRLLLQDKRVDPTSVFTVENRHAEVIKLLLEDGRADPSVNDNGTVKRASEKGRIEVVRLLLQDQRVIQAVRDSEESYLHEFIRENLTERYF